MAKSTSKAVAKQNQNQLPAGLEDMEQDAGAGLENTTKEDYQIPFLKVMQKLSPELNKRESVFVEGLEEGMILNSLTGQFWDSDEGILVCPVAFVFNFIEWLPNRGGLVAVHSRQDAPTPTSKNDRNQDVLENGNLLAPTAQHYVLLVDPNNHSIFEQALISMSSTQLKKSRRWNSLMAGLKLKGKHGVFNPPTYSHLYRLTTGLESNDQGDWYGWVIHNEGIIENKDLYESAKIFANAVTKGIVKATPVEDQDETEPPF